MATRQEEPPMEGAPEWITTFVDMISLLVTFFILLFTFSSTQEYQQFQFPQNIGGRPSPIEGDKDRSAIEAPAEDLMSAMHPTTGAPDPHTRPPEALVEQAEEMGQKPSDEELEFDLGSARDEIVVHFEASASFRPGETTVNESLRRSLEQLAEVMENYPHPVVIEGHTDAAFQPSPRFPTAEALSCARAVAAARVFLAAGNIQTSRVRVAGLGDTRPLNANVDALERTRNRRVNVRILPPESIDRGRGD